MATQTYQGRCQCGAISYAVDIDLDSTVTCNCSRCQKLGSVFAFTGEGAFRLEQGGDQLTEYLFHTKQVRHQFCKVCGIEGFAYGTMPDGSKTVAVNVNCLDGVDPRALKSQHYNGRDI